MRKISRKANKLQAVAVDMIQSYIKAIKANLSHVDIVIDRYNISALVNRAIDDLRRNLQNKLDEEGKAHLKKSKFLFLRNYSNLDDDNKAKLQVLLDTNAVVEGTNNKIKTLKRQAFGYRDMGCFKLRLYHLHSSSTPSELQNCTISRALRCCFFPLLL